MTLDEINLCGNKVKTRTYNDGRKPKLKLQIPTIMILPEFSSAIVPNNEEWEVSLGLLTFLGLSNLDSIIL